MNILKRLWWYFRSKNKFLDASELIDTDHTQFACVAIMSCTMLIKSETEEVRFFKKIYGLTTPSETFYSLYIDSFKDESKNKEFKEIMKELKEIRIMSLCMAQAIWDDPDNNFY